MQSIVVRRNAIISSIASFGDYTTNYENVNVTRGQTSRLHEMNYVAKVIFGCNLFSNFEVSPRVS